MKFRPAERKGGKVRVQAKVIAGVLKVRKWNYREKRWGRWFAFSPQRRISE